MACFMFDYQKTVYSNRKNIFKMHIKILIWYSTTYFNEHSNAFYYAVNKHVSQLITVAI